MWNSSGSSLWPGAAWRRPASGASPRRASGQWPADISAPGTAAAGPPAALPIVQRLLAFVLLHLRGSRPPGPLHGARLWTCVARRMPLESSRVRARALATTHTARPPSTPGAGPCAASGSQRMRPTSPRLSRTPCGKLLRWRHRRLSSRGSASGEMCPIGGARQSGPGGPSTGGRASLRCGSTPTTVVRGVARCISVAGCVARPNSRPRAPRRRVCALASLRSKRAPSASATMTPGSCSGSASTVAPSLVGSVAALPTCATSATRARYARINLAAAPGRAPSLGGIRRTSRANKLVRVAPSAGTPAARSDPSLAPWGTVSALLDFAHGRAADC